MNPEVEAQNAQIKNLRRTALALERSVNEEGITTAVVDLRQAANSIEDLAKLRWQAEHQFRERIRLDFDSLFREIVERETGGYESRLMFVMSDDDAGQQSWYFEAEAETSTFRIFTKVMIERG